LGINYRMWALMARWDEVGKACMMKCRESMEKVDISVCIATFRRPEGLRRLLCSLWPFCGGDEFRIEIIVVDNDAAGTARLVAERSSSKVDCLRYCIEPQQNIAHARNRAVREARGNWIAFIDDDEVAAKNWLAAYWHMVKNKPADGYFGPVLPQFECAGPAWLHKDVFFARPRYASGTKLCAGQMRTTNAFIRRSLFITHNFDPSYGLTGGEDSDIFARMVDAGAEFYWCDAAETSEYYPRERLRLRWLLQRAFRGGLTHTRIKRRRQQRYYEQIPGLVKAVVGICVFSLILPIEIVRGRKYVAKRLLRLSVQIGHISAFFNLTYEEYKVRN